MSLFQIKTEKFSGPLDLLLKLIEEKHLSVTDIALSSVTNEYLAYIREIEANSNELADFLVIASTLILIKSKAILPTLELTKEETEEILDLKERLILYKVFKEKSLYINNLFEPKSKLFSHQPFINVEVIFSPPSNLDVAMIHESLKEMLALYQKEKIILPIKKIKILVNLKDRIQNLFGIFKDKKNCQFKDIAGSKEDKIGLVVNFLAILHLAKEGHITLNQESNFGDIGIESSN